MIRPKNVGHEIAILQPFDDAQSWEWEEILVSIESI